MFEMNAAWLKDLQVEFAMFFEKEDSLFPLSVRMAQYQLETGGKRLRAMLPLLIYEAVGKNPTDILPWGAAVEMIHNATLVHDDLQDGDEVRRDQPTVWKRFGSEQAINCGDAMFFFAVDLVERLPLSPEIKWDLARLLSQKTLQVIEGQCQEFAMKLENRPGLKRYFEIIRGKTSGLFDLPVRGALLAAGWTSRECNACDAVSSDLGLLFQIQDDYLDLYGEKKRGGAKANDIREGKISYFAAYVFENGTLDDQTALEIILRKPRAQTTEEDVELALRIFERSGAHQQALVELKNLQGRIQAADRSLPSSLRQLFFEMGELILKPVL